MSFLSLVFGFFFIPELKNRSLEEIELMFEARIPLREFDQWESDANRVGTSISKMERLEIKNRYEVDLSKIKE